MLVQVFLFIFSLMITLLFFIYGFNHYFLLNASRAYRTPPLPDDDTYKPDVSIHLPVYNERYVIHRLMAACTRMAEAYGIDKVSILILDDSDDETTSMVDQIVHDYQQKHFKVDVLRRNNRVGYKAGALQAALEKTREEFIAIFDADFIPPADFLLRSLPFFARDEHLGIVQGRWAHQNRDFNFLTRAIALGIDIHFFIEQTGRFSARCFQNFNGSGGVLRKKYMLQVKGWSADTLAEDLDLSYRMQCQGSRILYLKDLSIPGELPPTVPVFKKQQARWANGSLRTARKILPGLLSDRKINLKQRAQALIHLTGYMIQPLMVISFLLTCLAIFVGHVSPGSAQLSSSLPAAGESFLTGIPPILHFQNLIWTILSPFIILCTLAPWLSAFAALKIQGFPLVKQLPTFFVFLLLGFGLSLSNTLAAYKALFSNRTWEFSRTPKYADLRNQQDWSTKRYQTSMDSLWMAELFFIMMGLLAIVSAFRASNFSVFLILVPFTLGYGFIFVFSVFQSRKVKP
jgi:cellulose synthase/poly-beta-1,6-N-acetylglucosamine synthase-like glycosyltransferase